MLAFLNQKHLSTYTMVSFIPLALRRLLLGSAANPSDDESYTF